MPRAYRLDEVAAEIGVSVKTLRREIRDGRLEGRRLRGTLVIYAAELDRYLAVAPTERSANAPRIHTVKRSPETQTGRVQRLVTPMVRQG